MTEQQLTELEAIVAASTQGVMMVEENSLAVDEALKRAGPQICSFYGMHSGVPTIWVKSDEWPHDCPKMEDVRALAACRNAMPEIISDLRGAALIIRNLQTQVDQHSDYEDLKARYEKCIAFLRALGKAADSIMEVTPNV